jgi:hypothetical protein
MNSCGRKETYISNVNFRTNNISLSLAICPDAIVGGVTPSLKCMA